MVGISTRETCFSSLAFIGKVCVSHVAIVLISHPVLKGKFSIKIRIIPLEKDNFINLYRYLFYGIIE